MPGGCSSVAEHCSPKADAEVRFLAPVPNQRKKGSVKVIDAETIAGIVSRESATHITDHQKIRYILIATALSSPENLAKPIEEIEVLVDGSLMPYFAEGGLAMFLKEGGEPMILASAEEDDEDENKDAPVTQSAE